MVMAISISDIMEAVNRDDLRHGYPGPLMSHHDYVCSEMLSIIWQCQEANDEHHLGRHALADIRYTHDGIPEGFGVCLAHAILDICGLAERLNVPLERCIVECLAYRESVPAASVGKSA